MTGPGTPDHGRQLALALPHRPATARADFLVAPSNALAVAWIDRWPDWPMPGLVVHGPEGCGKSHLAAVWAARAGATVLDAGDLVRPGGAPPGRGAAVIVEDVEARVAGDGAAEEGLFHLYNRIVDAKGALLLTGRGAPARWGIALDDLRSRLNALPSAAVSAPDDALLEALFVKHFADRQIRVGRDVVGYLVTRSERSHDAVRRLVAQLDRASLADRRTITVRFARRVLETEQG